MDKGGKEMGLPRVPPYLQALGLSTPDPWIHRGIHKTFYTEDSFCFRTLPEQACGAYPGGRNSNLTIHLSSSQHHRFGPPWPLPTPGPSHQVTWAWGAERAEGEEGGKKHSHGLHLRGQLSWARHCGTTPPPLLPLREVSS